MRNVGGLQAFFAITLLLCVVRELPAEESGVYVGASLGAANYSLDKDLSLVYGGSSVRQSTGMWSITAGYRFSSYFSVEGRYFDLGSVTGHAVRPTSAIGSVTTDYKVSIAGPAVMLVAALPVGRGEISAKAGAIFRAADVTVTNVGEALGTFSPPSTFQESSDSEDWVFGLSAGRPFAGNFRFDLEWLFYPTLGEHDRTDETKVMTIALGLGYRF